MNLKITSAAELAFQKAEITLAQKGRTFYWARRLMGPLHASRATRLYSFCRFIDDLADEASSAESGGIALARAAEDVTRRESAHPLIQDGIDLMQECGIASAVVLELISGVTSDLGQVRVADEDALLRYCYQVAGTVGLMMCKVLDSKDVAALPYAVDLGIAMQLTNICRDIAADGLVGRRYLPATLIGALEPQALVNPAESLQPRVRKCVETLLDMADRYYLSGELGLAYLPVGTRSGILSAARVYRAIGTRLRQRGSAYWLGRTVVPSSAKMALTLQALLEVPFKPSFWSPSKQHDAQLHRPFAGFFGCGVQPSAHHA